MNMNRVNFAYAPRELIEARHWFYEMDIQKALDKNFIGGDASEVVAKAIEGPAGILCINVLTDDGVQSVARCVIDVVDTNEGQMLRVISLTGTDMQLWLDELVMILRNCAEDNDCVGVTFTGRNGWARELDRYGFKTVQRIMCMRV